MCPHPIAADIGQIHQQEKQNWDTTPKRSATAWTREAGSKVLFLYLGLGWRLRCAGWRTSSSCALTALIRPARPSVTPAQHLLPKPACAHTSLCGDLRSQLSWECLTLKSHDQLAWDRCKNLSCNLELTSDTQPHPFCGMTVRNRADRTP